MAYLTFFILKNTNISTKYSLKLVFLGEEELESGIRDFPLKCYSVSCNI